MSEKVFEASNRSIVNELSASEAKNLYEEIDERMSRNSYEYPQQQAKYADDWLGDIANGFFHSEKRSAGLDSTKDHGNVIGIRGFDVTKREGYNRLKNEYENLRIKYNRLLAQFVSQVHNRLDQRLTENNNRIGEIKLLISNQDRACCSLINGCKCDITLDRERMQEEITQQMRAQANYRDIESKLEKTDIRNEQLTNVLKSKDAEIANLNALIETLSLRPFTREIDKLMQQNTNLNVIDGENSAEYRQLHEDYKRLETEIQEVDHHCSLKEDEVDKQACYFMIELYRLQVHHHKLEQILTTEAQIKSELQNKINALLEEKQELKRNIEIQANQFKLMLDQNRCDGELNRLNRVILQLRDKCSRLEEEKSADENALRLCQDKCNDLESRLVKAQTAYQEQSKSKLNDTKKIIDQFEQDKRNLVSKVEDFKARLIVADEERLELTNKLCELHRKLESTNSLKHFDNQVQIMSQHENTINKLQRETCAKDMEVSKLRADESALRSQLEYSKKQYDELKRRYDLQVETINEVNSKKDKEMAKLRIDLNYERYNRQVAVRSVERDLRASLKELEVMKCRIPTCDNNNVLLPHSIPNKFNVEVQSIVKDNA